MILRHGARGMTGSAKITTGRATMAVSCSGASPLDMGSHLGLAAVSLRPRLAPEVVFRQLSRARNLRHRQEHGPAKFYS
jgi:hypothetical protein